MKVTGAKESRTTNVLMIKTSWENSLLTPKSMSRKKKTT